MAARIYGYFDDYKSETFACPDCGWSGGYKELALEMHRDLTDGSCPHCDKMLIIVSYPTSEEIREAAAAGNEDAVRSLPLVQRREELDAQFDRDGLKSPDQLPDLPDNELEFTWDWALPENEEENSPEDKLTGTTAERDKRTLILHDGHVIWQEPAFYEGWPRFNEVKAILLAKYGARFKSLTPTDAAKLYLFGDDLNSPRKISYGREKPEFPIRSETMNDIKEALSPDEEWQRLTTELGTCLAALNEDEFLVLTHKRTSRYVQFAAQGEFGTRIEAAGNANIEPATAGLALQDYLAMAKLGWHLPNDQLGQQAGAQADPDGSPNFFLDVASPVDFQAAATLAVQTLRGVYRIHHPGMLVYKAFASKGPAIRFPTLRLKLDDG